MRPVRQSPKHELVAARLIEGMRDGRWTDSLPGVLRLASEMDVAPNTVRRAIRQLEEDGVLSHRGKGRGRTIAAAGISRRGKAHLSIAILRHDRSLRDNPHTSLVLTEIMHALETSGHTVFFCEKSQSELEHSVRGISGVLSRTRADAWLIEAGSRRLLEWCVGRPTPCMALYGDPTDLSIAGIGPEGEAAFRDCARHLIDLGHRRIVYITGGAHRKPGLGRSAQALMDELVAHDIQVSSYNFPDWEETPQGFEELLERLFRHTPPTALIVDESPQVIAALAFLARKGISVPEQVSVISAQPDGVLDWCHPPLAHMAWDATSLMRHIVRWAEDVRKGREHKGVTGVPMYFEPGGTTGRAE